jgi:putative DNA primase/helicase
LGGTAATTTTFSSGSPTFGQAPETRPLHLVLHRLGRVRKSGAGWSAQCPAHEDRNPSLSVSEGEDGRVLLTCHAGCELADIVHALGLSIKDLFASDAERQPANPVVATYDYVDEAGRRLFQVIRKADKQFVQRRPDGAGGWVWKLGDTRRVPYRLPKILEAVAAGIIVWCVEGEKDVHALERLGLVGTCNPGGAGKWLDSYSELLTGASVVVVADQDDAGRLHGHTVAASLTRHGVAVRLIDLLPIVTPSGDVSDLIDQVRAKGGDDATCRSTLLHLADRPLWPDGLEVAV